MEYKDHTIASLPIYFYLNLSSHSLTLIFCRTEMLLLATRSYESNKIPKLQIKLILAYKMTIRISSVRPRMVKPSKT